MLFQFWYNILPEDAPYSVTGNQARFISMKLIKRNSRAMHEYPIAPRIFRHFTMLIFCDCRFAEYPRLLAKNKALLSTNIQLIFLCKNLEALIAFVF